MKHDFVHLHDSDGDDVFVRAACIVAVVADDQCTHLWVEGDSDTIGVSEAPAVVLALIDDLAIELPDGTLL